MTERTYFILDKAGEIIPTDLITWAKWLETSDEERVIGETVISKSPEVLVSTVFIGACHDAFHRGKPLMYETMIFRDGHGAECWRYTTRAAAVAGHAHAVELAKIEVADEATS